MGVFDWLKQKLKRKKHTISTINYNTSTLKKQYQEKEAIINNVDFQIEKVTSPINEKKLKDEAASYENKYSIDINFQAEEVTDTINKRKLKCEVTSCKNKHSIDTDIIDISEITPTQIIKDKEIPQTNDNDDFWIKHLEVPYKRKIMNNQQIEQETLNMYNRLCEYTDTYLKNCGKSLVDEVKRVEKKGGSYNNLLYTFYCIAEGHVTKSYSNGNNYYDNNYSYGILQQHLGTVLKNKIYEKAIELEKFLSIPNSQTLNSFYTPRYCDNITWAWWDIDGKLRKNEIFDKQSIIILNVTPSRDTKIWQLLEVKKEILNLYLNLWKIIIANIQRESIWKKTSLSNVKKVLKGETECLYNERTYNFLSSFVKLTESTVRNLLPKSSYTQNLNIENDIDLVKSFLPKEVMNEINLILESYKKNIPKETLIILIDALANSEAVNSKVILEKLLLSNDNQRIETLLKYQSYPEYEKFLKEIAKKTEDDNLFLLVIYELSRIDKLQIVLQKKAADIIYKDNISDFESTLEKKKQLSIELYHQLLEFKKPVRKKIRLDLANIEQSKEEFEQTIEVLSQYINEEDTAESLKHEEEKASVEKAAVVSEEEQIFSAEAIKLLKTLLEKNYIDIEVLRNEAMLQGKLLSSYISDINKEFFEYVGDQLILIEEDIVKVDDYYIDMVKELLKYEN